MNEDKKTRKEAGPVLAVMCTMMLGLILFFGSISFMSVYVPAHRGGSHIDEILSWRDSICVISDSYTLIESESHPNPIYVYEVCGIYNFN